MSVYKLNASGLQWAKANQETALQPNPPDYANNMFEKVQLILSDKFLGFFMVPEGGVWNYNFNGQNFSQHMRYTLMLDNPIDFYNEAHRTIHFLDFAAREDVKSTVTTDAD